MSKILVIGSSNTDMVVRTQKFPKPGETLLGGDFFMFSGGKGANQTVAAARMGARVNFICKIGSDIFGKSVLEELEREGVSTDYIIQDKKNPSGIALILVDEKGENEIVVASGANKYLNTGDIDQLENAFDGINMLLMQLEIPLDTVLFASKKATMLGIKVILNPAPAVGLPSELYRHLFLITPNETEAELLTGAPVRDPKTASKAADFLLERGVANVIITMGAAGAFFKNKEIEMMVPAPEVDAIDSTAAGDVFNGVLAVELNDGINWEKAIRTACMAASISVTRMGAQSSMPYRKEI